MEWQKFLVKYYKDRKSQNADYKFSKAMKDARGPYRKQLSGGADPITETAPEEPSMGGSRRRSMRSRRQLSGGEGPEVPVEGTPAPEPPAVTGGKKSRRQLSGGEGPEVPPPPPVEDAPAPEPPVVAGGKKSRRRRSSKRRTSKKR